MNVYDVMTSHPVVILSGASIAEALQKMRNTGCHHLPVLSTAQHLIGVISFHDCQRALGDPLRGNGLPTNAQLATGTTVGQVMTPAPIIIEPDAPAHQAAYLMLEHFIGCLPVMRGETLVGIVTRSDLLMAFMQMSQKPDSTYQRKS
jgi:acetoin utilization protein AcuB